jgi:hypothetical protein
MLFHALTKFWSVLFVGILLSSTPLFAQTQKLNTAVTAAPVSLFNILFTAGHSRSLYDFQDGTVKESNDFEIIPTYNGSLFKTRGYLAYSQDLHDSEKGDVSDLAILNYFRGWTLPRAILTPTLNFVLPASKDSAKNRSLQLAMSVGLRAQIPPQLLIKGFSASGMLSGSRNIHRYDTALDGSVNSVYSSRQGIALGYDYKRVSFSGEFYHINSWSYDNNMQEAFEHIEEFSVEAYKHTTLVLGHTNSGSIFRPNGYESNIQLVDENNSLVYLKVALSY